MLVSIVIPHYNRPKELKRAIQSVLNQKTKHQIEIIVVDDCSTENFQRMERNSIQYVYLNKNQGPGYCRNIGKNLAQGKYIAFLDSDDYYHPEFVDTLVNLLELNQTIIMAYAQSMRVDDEGSHLGYRWGKACYNTILPNIFTEGRRWHTSSCIWRTEMIKSIEWIPTYSWEDVAFEVEAALRVNLIGYSENILLFYQVDSLNRLSNNEGAEKLKRIAPAILHIVKTIISIPGYIECKYHLFNKTVGYCSEAIELKNKELEKRYFYIMTKFNYISKTNFFLLKLLPYGLRSKFLRSLKKFKAE